MIRRIFKKDVWLALIAIAVLGALVGTVVLLSGIMPLGASSGHWPITRWFLDFAKVRSVSTHSLGTKAPPLDDPDLILKGAVHYDIGCRSCHGSPGLKNPRIPGAMTPAPPYLPDQLARWSPAELFQITKHGIKFTGMPAWPALERDDEVWAVVAFLRKFPELDDATYREMVGGGPLPTAPMEELGLAPATSLAIHQSCARCHGEEGIARGDGAFPDLAGQHRDYLYNSLKAYSTGERQSGMMGPIAAGLDEQTIRELSDYYSKLKARPKREVRVNAGTLELGREIARTGIPHERIPSCMECHDPDGRRAKSAYPSLTGQAADYLALQLRLFKERKRGGSDYVHLMHQVADRLDDEQVRAVSSYFESLPSAGE